MYLGLISLDSIFDFLGCVAEEMVGLALHRSESALHPGHPFHYFPVPASLSIGLLWKREKETNLSESNGNEIL